MIFLLGLTASLMIITTVTPAVGASSNNMGFKFSDPLPSALIHQPTGFNVEIDEEKNI